MAALSRVERLPELAPLLAHVRGEADDGQDAEEQIDAARSIVAAFGSESFGTGSPGTEETR